MPTNVPVSQTFTFEFNRAEVLQNGDWIHTFLVKDATGAVKMIKMYLLKADGSGIYDMGNGSQLATSSSTRVTNLNGYRTNVDGDMAAALAAGKIVF